MPDVGPGFFEAMAQVLAEPGSLRSKSKSSLPAVETPPVKQPGNSPWPQFKDVAALEAYLQGEFPRLFPGSPTPIALAEGIQNSPLGLVELSPERAFVASNPLRVFDGEAGALLAKMMKSIHLDLQQLFRTAVMRTPPTGQAWARKDIARMLPALFQELRLAACPIHLLMGETCAQAVLRKGSGLEEMRQNLFREEGLVFAITYHPADLLKNETLKRNAWEDLKWLRSRFPSDA